MRTFSMLHVYGKQTTSINSFAKTKCLVFFIVNLYICNDVSKLHCWQPFPPNLIKHNKLSLGVREIEEFHTLLS